LNAQCGSDIVKAEVLLPNGVIRELGSFAVVLDLGYAVTATINLAVQGLDAAAGVSADGSMIEEIEQAEAAEADAVEQAEEETKED
jgi:hypothetical protein